MPDLILPSIVEGHGEVRSLPVLMRRLLADLAPQLTYRIPEPIRIPRGSFVNRPDERARALNLAVSRLPQPSSGFVVILYDADDDCPASLGPALLQFCRTVRPDYPLALVLANREYEAWFLAASESLQGQRMLPSDLQRPADPEAIADAKGWIKARRSDRKYSPTIDQPAYSAIFNLEEARLHSRSFNKFHREFSRLLAPYSR